MKYSIFGCISKDYDFCVIFTNTIKVKTNIQYLVILLAFLGLAIQTKASSGEPLYPRMERSNNEIISLLNSNPNLCNVYAENINASIKAKNIPYNKTIKANNISWIITNHNTWMTGKEIKAKYGITHLYNGNRNKTTHQIDMSSYELIDEAETYGVFDCEGSGVVVWIKQRCLNPEKEGVIEYEAPTENANKTQTPVTTPCPTCPCPTCPTVPVTTPTFDCPPGYIKIGWPIFKPCTVDHNAQYASSSSYSNNNSSYSYSNNVDNYSYSNNVSCNHGNNCSCGGRVNRPFNGGYYGGNNYYSGNSSSSSTSTSATCNCVKIVDHMEWMCVSATDVAKIMNVLKTETKEDDGNWCTQNPNKCFLIQLLGMVHIGFEWVQDSNGNWTETPSNNPGGPGGPNPTGGTGGPGGPGPRK
jgi:hypothetical protein